MSQAPDIDTILDSARTAWQQRDGATAVQHLATAVEMAPNRPEVQSLLDTISTEHDEPFTLVPITGQMTFGIAGVYSWFLYRAGKIDEALQWVAQLALANPDTGISDWPLDWCERDDLSDEHYFRATFLFVAALSKRFPEDIVEDPDRRAVLERWAPYVERYRARIEQETTQRGIYSIVLRKMGRVDDAIAEAQRRYDEEPNYMAAVFLSNAHRIGGDEEGWEKACRMALEHNPDDPFVRLDLADGMWDRHDDLEKAEYWYTDALRYAPDNDWATPSRHALRYLRTEDFAHRAKLEDYSARHPDNQRATDLASRLTPNFGFLFLPSDAALSVMEQLSESLGEFREEGVTGKIDMKSTGLEAASIHTAFLLQFEEGADSNVTLKPEVMELQTPDPREPRAEVAYRLWEYDGLIPRAVVEPAGEEVTTLLGQMAEIRYSIGDWVENARRAVARLHEHPVEEFLGVMAHPPKPPEWCEPWYWMFRVQMAASLVIGQMPERDWRNSIPRRVLSDLTNGPLDWTIVTAGVALTVIGIEETDTTGDIADELRVLIDGLPQPGQLWYTRSLLSCLLRLPSIDLEERHSLLDRLEKAERANREASDGLAEFARMHWNRTPPEGVVPDDAVHGMLITYANGDMLDDPAFVPVAKAYASVLEHQIESGEDTLSDEAKEYLREEVWILRAIQKALEKRE